VDRKQKSEFVAMWKVQAALALCLAMPGCAIVKSQQSIDAGPALIGKGRAEIMACAGIPDYDTKEGQREIATYVVVGAARHLVSGAALGNGQCTTRITYEKGRVIAIDYTVEDPGVLSPLESCAQIIAGCLR